MFYPGKGDLGFLYLHILRVQQRYISAPLVVHGYGTSCVLPPRAGKGVFGCLFPCTLRYGGGAFLLYLRSWRKYIPVVPLCKRYTITGFSSYLSLLATNPRRILFSTTLVQYSDLGKCTFLMYSGFGQRYTSVGQAARQGCIFGFIGSHNKGIFLL